MLDYCEPVASCVEMTPAAGPLLSNRARDRLHKLYRKLVLVSSVSWGGGRPKFPLLYVTRLRLVRSLG